MYKLSDTKYEMQGVRLHSTHRGLAEALHIKCHKEVYGSVVFVHERQGVL
jgi:hypothetical protein